MTEPNWELCSAVDMSGDKVWHCFHCFLIYLPWSDGTRVNIDILGISELRWTGMGEFNSYDHYIYHCGQESLRRNGVAIIVNKRVQNAVLGCNLKNYRIISVCFQSKLFSITGQGIALDYHDIEWLALEMNRNHSVFFEIATKHWILDSCWPWWLLHFF